MSPLAWPPQRATGWLLERGMFGVRPGLERMRALLDELGGPHEGMRNIHVVGTNGKSSTTRFAAHLLAERGSTAGAYLSPHLVGFEERVLLPGPDGLEPATAEGFAEAVGVVAEAAGRVEASLADGDRITQFEAVTAAALLMIARSGAAAAVIEAGLGGRLDATNVLGPGVVALTSVGLDHMEWLGDDIESIATEKLAVVGPGDRLVVTGALDPSLDGLAEAAASRSGHPLTVAPAAPGDGIVPLARGAFQAGNLALAAAAVDLLLGSSDPTAVERVAATVAVPGRMQRIAGRPETIVDSAHNPAGMAALAAEIEGMAGGRKCIAVIGVLADKDAVGMVDAILPAVDALIPTSPVTPRALPAAELAAIASRTPGATVEEPTADSREALARARSLAGPDGVVIAAGSVHVVGELLSRPGERTVTSL